MKNSILAFVSLVLVSTPALASKKSEKIAEIFARGVYAQMDRQELAQNPNLKITLDLQESHASSRGNEIYKAIRRTDDGASCGAIVYVTNGVPTLETDIDCAK